MSAALSSLSDGSERPKRRPVADRRLIQMRLRISQPLLKSIQRVRPSAQQLALLEQCLPLGENLFPQAGKVVVFKMGHNILHGKIRLPVFLEREQQNQLIFVVIPRAVFALFRGDHAFLFIKAQAPAWSAPAAAQPRRFYKTSWFLPLPAFPNMQRRRTQQKRNRRADGVDHHIDGAWASPVGKTLMKFIAGRIGRADDQRRPRRMLCAAQPKARAPTAKRAPHIPPCARICARPSPAHPRESTPPSARPNTKVSAFSIISVTKPLCSPETSPGMADIIKIKTIQAAHRAHAANFLIRKPLFIHPFGFMIAQSIEKRKNPTPIRPVRKPKLAKNA